MFMALGSLDNECVAKWSWNSRHCTRFLSGMGRATEVEISATKFKSLGVCHPDSRLAYAHAGHRYSFQLLSGIALFLSLPGLALLFLGTERTKAILFPLCILLLTLPIPLVFTESIHLVLRKIATKSVAWLLDLFGVPVFSTGTLLEVEGGSLMVADACSGFATLYAAITIAILTAYFCNSVRRRILLLLIAAPLAIAVNIMRVLLLTLLVNWFGLDVLATAAHEISGLLTFVIALPIIFFLGQIPLLKHRFVRIKNDICSLRTSCRTCLNVGTNTDRYS